MKIIIFNDELRSQMQMYLALRHQHQVEIAEDQDALLHLLQQVNPDVTFLDLNYSSGENNGEAGIKIAEQIRKKYPKIRIVGIHNGHDAAIEQKAHQIGLQYLITRPIKNRELRKMIE